MIGYYISVQVHTINHTNMNEMNSNFLILLVILLPSVLYILPSGCILHVRTICTIFTTIFFYRTGVNLKNTFPCGKMLSVKYSLLNIPRSLCFHTSLTRYLLSVPSVVLFDPNINVSN